MRFQCQGKETPAVHAALPRASLPLSCAPVWWPGIFSVCLYTPGLPPSCRHSFVQSAEDVAQGQLFPGSHLGPRCAMALGFAHWLPFLTGCTDALMQPVGLFPRRGCAELTDLWFTVFTGHYFFKYFYALKGSKSTSGTFCGCCTAP